MLKYKLTVVGANLAAHRLEGVDMNEAGHVAGVDQGEHAPCFFYEPQHGVHHFTGMAFPTSINASDVVVGSSRPHWEDGHPCLYEAGGSAATSIAQPFEDGGATAVELTQICDNGDILGGAVMGGGDRHAVRLTKEKQVEDLTKGVAQDGLATIAIAQNKHGFIVGDEGTEGAWACDPSAGSFWATAPMQLVALNDHGESVGFYVPYPDDLQNVPSGMFFTKTGQWSKLPDSPEAGSFVHPVGINNARLILSRGAWVYDHQDPASGWVDLNDRLVDPTPWTIDEGVTIKNNGLILCNGSAPAGLLQEQIRPLILTPVFDEADRPSPTIELSRWRAVMQILFGIVNDAPGIGLVGGIHPHRVGPGPDDPDGPRRETLASLTAGQRDVLLGLAISEIGTLLSNPAHGRAARALAESVVARASRRLGVERSSRPAAWLSGSLRVARINERFARGRARSVAAPNAR